MPDPVLPTTAVVSPGRTVNETPVTTDSSAPGYLNPTPSKHSAPVPTSSVTGASGSATVVGVSSTSWMRSAHTAARGTSTTMNVTISSAMRIWIR